MASPKHSLPSEQNFVPRLMYSLNIIFSRVYHNLEVLSPCNLPRHGPAILVCNHISGIDPMLIQSVCPRVIRWMMAREYYEQRGLKWMLDQIGTIPVDRSGRDLAATRTALAALKSGGILGIFPEGRISTTSELLPFQQGIMLLAAKSGAPVYPACVEGTQRGREMLAAYLIRSRAQLAFGEPIFFDREAATRQNIDLSTEKVRTTVELLRRTYRLNRNCQ
jgi:1-acyl-sn-glycerol-3-phosphate acyltransferase